MSDRDRLDGELEALDLIAHLDALGDMAGGVEIETPGGLDDRLGGMVTVLAQLAGDMVAAEAGALGLSVTDWCLAQALSSLSRHVAT